MGIKIFIILCLTLFVGANGQGIGSLLSLFGGNGNTNTQQQNGMASLGGGSTGPATSINYGAKKGIYAWGAWGEYGPCTATCGNGQKGRQRACYFFEGLSDTDSDGIALKGFTNSIGAEGMELLPLLLGSGGDGGLLGGGGGLSSIITLSLLSGGTNGGGILGGLTKSGNGRTTATASLQQGCQGLNVNRTICNVKACPAVVIPSVQPTIAQCLGQWSDYGECSRTCGVGIQIRFRACNCRNPQTQRFTCSERLTETKPCTGLLQCPLQPIVPVLPTTRSPPTVVSGKWSEWGAWSGCNARCGEDSTERRLRFCLQINNCQGAFSETRACPNVPCPVEEPVWSQWGQYGECTQTCGNAQKIRRRSCPVGNACAGLSIEVTDCANAPCATPAADAEWEQWSEFGLCISACGPGQRFRFRRCSIPNQCEGISSDSEPCNNPACEKEPSPAKWGDWGEYSTCTRSCGGGLKSRVRICIGEGQCPGDGTQSTACEEQPCIVQPVIPQVGVWGEYGPWGECKKTTFGQGCFEERIRFCTGAIRCEGVNVERRLCNTGACAVVETPSPTVTNVNQQACDESFGERTDCGFPGITREECWAKGCCYDDNTFGTNWCFYNKFSKAARTQNTDGL